MSAGRLKIINASCFKPASWWPFVTAATGHRRKLPGMLACAVEQMQMSAAVSLDTEFLPHHVTKGTLCPFQPLQVGLLVTRS